MRSIPARDQLFRPLNPLTSLNADLPVLPGRLLHIGPMHLKTTSTLVPPNARVCKMRRLLPQSTILLHVDRQQRFTLLIRSPHRQLPLSRLSSDDRQHWRGITIRIHRCAGRTLDRLRNDRQYQDMVLGPHHQHHPLRKPRLRNEWQVQHNLQRYNRHHRLPGSPSFGRYLRYRPTLQSLGQQHQLCQRLLLHSSRQQFKLSLSRNCPKHLSSKLPLQGNHRCQPLIPRLNHQQQLSVKTLRCDDRRELQIAQT